jgi:glyoxylase-like metal-dependent hydrolase (beta-lactamase superfamily II)
MVKRLLIPSRSSTYLDRLERDNVKLKYIFETHFHFDFVSGHLDLSKKTGAPIVYGKNANQNLKQSLQLKIKNFLLEHQNKSTAHPGHTMESTTYLLIDKDETAIFWRYFIYW